MKHLIFFDAHCSLCLRSIQRVLDIDQKELFAFAPLGGKTAASQLGTSHDVRKENSLVLLEHWGTPQQKLWMRGRAVCRILWLSGGLWRLVGWLCFLPFGVDALYRLIAKHRTLVPMQEESFSNEEMKRFLP